ncbi:unnamed protein product, partial [marine sediment metagenome]
ELKGGIFGAFDLKREIVGRLTECDTGADLGCGTGDLLPELGEKANLVIGVDSSPRMLEQARRHYAGYNKKIQLRIGELEHLPFSNEELDFAVIKMVLHHLLDPAAGIREAQRALKKGSRLIIADFNKHHDETLRTRCGDRWLGFSASEIENWLTGAGLSVKERTEFPLKGHLTVALYSAAKI